MSGSKSRNLRLLPENGNERDVATGKYSQMYRNKYSRYAGKVDKRFSELCDKQAKGITFG